MRPGTELSILIEVPPKPEELKPFLVRGAIVVNRLEGAFISIVRRRGEASIPITAPMLREVEKMIPTVETGQPGSRDKIRHARETTADPQAEYPEAPANCQRQAKTDQYAAQTPSAGRVRN